MVYTWHQVFHSTGDKRASTLLSLTSNTIVHVCMNMFTYMQRLAYVLRKAVLRFSMIMHPRDSFLRYADTTTICRTGRGDCESCTTPTFRGSR